MKRLVLFIALFFVQTLLAQAPVLITIVAPGPHSPLLENYTGNADQYMLITLTNTTQANLQLKLKGDLIGTNGVHLFTKENYQPPIPIMLSPNQTKILTPSEIGLFFNEGALGYEGINRNEVVLTRKIPEGEYYYCIEAYDFNSSGYNLQDLLSALASQSICATLNIEYIEPPIVQTVGNEFCGDIISNEAIDAMGPNQFLTLGWLFPAGVHANTSYRVTIVEMNSTNSDPNQAINSATSPVWYESTVNTNFLIIDNSFPKLRKGMQYAFRIQATNTTQVFRNKGFSEVCSFHYGQASNLLGTSGQSISQIYPAPGSTIPFNKFPVIIKFQPYDDNIISFNSTYELRSGGALIEKHSRHLDWPYGPLQSQIRSTHISQLTQDRAQHISINEILPEGSKQTYSRGKNYSFNVSTSMIMGHSGPVLNNDLAGQFEVGMPRPNLLSPAKDSIVRPGTITLSFNTGIAPEHILPPFEIFQSERNNGIAGFTGAVSEKLCLRVSKSRSFPDSNLVLEYFESVGEGFNLSTKSESEIKLALYKNITRELNISDTGTYYWQVAWLNQPIGIDHRSIYNESEIFSFVIRNSATLVDSTPPPRATPASCLANCEAALPADLTAVNSINVGQGVRFGNFTLTITGLTSSSSPFSGVGTVPVPFLGCQIRVNFSNLRVNGAMIAFSGNAVAVVDEPSVISTEMSRYGGSLVGIDDAKAREINNLVNSGNRLVSLITGTNPIIGMPIGLDNTLDGVRTTVAIVGINFTPTKANLNAVVNIDVPELNGWLSLGAADICFHPQGVNANEGILYNPTEKLIRFSPDVEMAFTASSATPVSAADSGTYVQWDCQGFKALQIAGEFRFSNTLLVKDNTNGSPGNEIVKARFSTKVTRTNGWMLNLDMDNFQFVGLPEWGFTARNIVFDFSTIQNATGMVFPDRYTGTSSNEWKGFYMQQLEVRLPHHFRTFSDTNRRLSFTTQNMIIDRTGFSGIVRANNVVQVTQGTIDGWAFGIDTVLIEIVSNGFRQSRLSGVLKLPVAAEPLTYGMILNRNTSGQFGYECLVTPRDTMNLTMISPAKIAIMPTSRVEITKRAGENFRVMGVLSGNINIDGDFTGIGHVNLPNIHVEQFRVQNQTPYVSCTSVSLGGGASGAGVSPPPSTSPTRRVAGFPVSIDSIRFIQTDNISLFEFDNTAGPRVGISIGVSLQLINNNNTFGGKTRIGFMSRISNSSSSPLAVNFTGFSLEEISIRGTIGPVRLNGGLQFYASNPTYGEGIRGFINAVFSPAVELDAIVQFGSKSNHPYFYVDGSAQFTSPIMLLPGMNLKGFGGAVYYGMSISNMPSAESIPDNRTDISTLGATSTGAIVTPDANRGFGFMAKMFVSSVTPGSYLGMLGAGASFSASGGVASMNIDGRLVAMTNSTDYSAAKVKAQVNMNYDFENKVFDGVFDCWINFNGVVRGRGADNRAGTIHMHADTNLWFIKIGNPSQRMGLLVNLGVSIDVNSYIMVGSSIDPIPDLPPQIVNLLSQNGSGTAPSSVRDARVLSQAGFAFGAALDLNVPRIDFLIFYAKLHIILGFDLAVVNTPGVTCSNTENGVRGSDGWYAEGQVYGYFHGDIGIHVDVWFIQGDFPIIDVQLAAAVMGGFPNPNWVKGYLAGEYRILGGLIQGHCNFEVGLGQKCVNSTSDALNGIELVANLSPSNGATNVDVFVSPFAAFNMKPGFQDTITITNSENQKELKTFRVMYKDFTMTGNGLNIRQSTFNGPMQFATLEKSSDGNIYGFSPIEGLTPYTRYTLSITAYLEVLRNGVWVVERNRNNALIQKTYTHEFTTGAFPSTITDGLIRYSYPHRGQRFLLQNECRNGLIQARTSIRGFFPATNESGWAKTYFVDFVPVDGSSEPIRTVLNTATINTSINFTIPVLQNNKSYAIRIVAQQSSPGNSGGIGNVNLSNINAIKTTQTTISYAGGSSSMVSNYSAIMKPNISEKVIYVLYFKTSQFNTLSDKMASTTNIRSTENNLGEQYAGDGVVRSLNIMFANSEGFDVYDAIGEAHTPAGSTNGLSFTSPLVRFTHIASNNDNIRRQQQVYNLYSRAISTSIINSTFFAGASTFSTPSLPFVLADDYSVRFNSNGSYLPKLEPNQFLPAPPTSGPGILGGGITISTPSTILIYTGYMDAHRAKTRMANILTLINGTPFYVASYYLQRSTPQDRTDYQTLIQYRRFSGYPICQQLIIRGTFSSPLNCPAVPDQNGGSGFYNLNVIYPPCQNGPN